MKKTGFGGDHGKWAQLFFDFDLIIKGGIHEEVFSIG